MSYPPPPPPPNYYGAPPPPPPPIDTQAPPAGPFADLYSSPYSSNSLGTANPPFSTDFLNAPLGQQIKNHIARRSKSQDLRSNPLKDSPAARRTAAKGFDFQRTEMKKEVSYNTPPPSLRKYTSRSPTPPPMDPSSSTSSLAVRTRGLKDKPASPFNRTQSVAPYPQEEEPESLIMIGIDFGTTYSGVAWACSENPDDIKTVTNWQSHDYMNTDKEKAPTEIAYGSDRTTWGYGIPDTESVKWFKLLLLDEDDMEPAQRNSAQITRARELLATAGKTAVEAIGDYLRFLFEHALESIKQDMGEIAVEGYAFRIVLTVPAVWTTKALKRMRLAAREAGLLDSRLAGETKLHFVSEPEAAALATFSDMKSRPNFQEGDTFVVCDAGGGTVDLISYRVHQTSPMQLKECVKGSGGLCGAVFLDQDFEALMEQLLGDFWTVGDDAMKRIMKVDWENGIKRGFDGAERDWKVTLPYECTSRGAPPFITLSKGHVGEIFENVTSQIRALVNDQIKSVKEKEGKLPKAVVLVGGFGSCRYLFNILQKENKDRGITVHKSTGAKPWTAICRGAVLKALTNSNMPGVTVESRISRHSYGILCSPRFVEGLHRDEDRYYDPIDARDRARDQMEWYLRKGDDIEEQKPLLLRWQKFFPLSSIKADKPLSMSTVIRNCEDDAPPSRLQSNIKPAATIHVSLDTASLPDFRGKDGIEYKKVSYAIEMTVIGTALEFSLIFDGKKMGAQNVEVEFGEDAPPRNARKTSAPGESSGLGWNNGRGSVLQRPRLSKVPASG